MEVTNCKQCRRIFNYIAGPRICPACRQKLEEKFQEVKDYIRDNPQASIAEVAEAMDVGVQQLRQWVREERLCFAEGAATGMVCENCGVMIRMGRFCDKCKGNVAKELESAYQKPHTETPIQKDKRERARMRFLDN